MSNHKLNNNKPSEKTAVEIIMMLEIAEAWIVARVDKQSGYEVQEHINQLKNLIYEISSN